MDKVSKQLEINAPVEAVFDLFKSFTHFPRWMKGVKKVEQTAPGRTRWTVEAPDGTLGEWETEITEVEFGRRISWRSTANQIIAAEGEASFAEAKPGVTLLQLTLGYDSPPDQADVGIAAAFNNNLAERLAEDLIWFRLLVERGGQATGNTGSVRASTAVPLSNAATGAEGQPFTEPTNKSSVHFDTFSSIRRAGQMIRPARLATLFLSDAQARQRAAHAPIVVNLDEAANRPNDKATTFTTQPSGTAPVPVYRSIVASLIVVGMLVIGGVGWIATSKWPTAPIVQHNEPTATETAVPPTNDAAKPAAAAEIEPPPTIEQEEALTAAAAAAAVSLVQTSKGKAAARQSGSKERTQARAEPPQRHALGNGLVESGGQALYAPETRVAPSLTRPRLVNPLTNCLRCPCSQ